MLSLGDIQLTSAGQLVLAAMEKSASEPVTELTPGRIYYNTTSHKLFVYRDGSPGGWTEITSGQFVSGMADFTDVTFTSLANSDTLIYSNGQFINAPIQHLYSYTGTGTTSHVVTHNLNQQIVNVEVYDTSTSPAKLIIPDSITLTSLNSCTVTLNVDIHCDIFVFGVGGDVVQMTTLPISTGTSYSGGMTITRGEGYTQFYAPTVASRIRFGAGNSNSDWAFEFSVHSLGTTNNLEIGLGTGNTDMSNASTWFTGLTKYVFIRWTTSGTCSFPYKKGNDSGVLTSPALAFNRRYGFRYDAVGTFPAGDYMRIYQTFPSDATALTIGLTLVSDTYYLIMNIPAGGCVRIYDENIGTTTAGVPKWVL